MYNEDRVTVCDICGDELPINETDGIYRCNDCYYRYERLCEEHPEHGVDLTNDFLHGIIE